MIESSFLGKRDGRKILHPRVEAQNDDWKISHLRDEAQNDDWKLLRGDKCHAKTLNHRDEAELADARKACLVPSPLTIPFSNGFQIV